MSDQFSSLDIDLLSAHLTSGRRIATDSESSRTTLTNTQTNVVARCPDNYWDGMGTTLAGDLIALWAENHGAATLIRDEVGVDASGVVPIDDNAIEKILFDHGYSQPPEEVAVERGEAVGLLPMSGFADDPVCTFNGNFIYLETDLSTAGFAELIDVDRIYNSMMAERRGLFGWGWTTALDMNVAVEPSGAQVTIADGATVPFPTDGNGGFSPNRRRHLHLEVCDDGWSLDDGAGQTWRFDRLGRLVGGRRRGGSFTVDWSSSNLIEVVEAQSGRSVSYHLDEDGLVNSVRSSDGRRADYEYQQGHCLAVRRASGDTTYEVAANLIVAVLDADGVLACRNTYDNEGRVASQLSPHGTETIYSYQDNRTTRLAYNNDGTANLYFHDERGRLVAMFGADGRAMRTNFDEFDRPIRVVDRSGLITEFTYDGDTDHDQWIRKTIGDDVVEERTFDALGRLSQHVDANGGVHQYEYDQEHWWPVVVRNPMGGETVSELDATGLPVSIIDADGYSQRLDRNADGLVSIIVDSAGHFVSHSYDTAARLTTTTDGDGNRHHHDFDAAGRALSTTAHDGSIKRFRYSPAGRMVACDVSGGGSWAATYGTHGEMETFVDAIGGTLAFGYDVVGNPISMTLPDGGLFHTEFDAMGQVTAITDPAGNRFEQTLHPSGLMRSVTDAQGAAWRFTFDAQGRVVEEIDALGAVTRFAYHPGGQLRQRTTAEGSEYHEINAAGWQIAVVDQAGGRSEIDYSPAGRPLTRTSPTGRSITYRYNDAGSLFAIVDADGNEVAPGSSPEAAAALLPDGPGLAPAPQGPAQLDPSVHLLLGSEPPDAGAVLAALHRMLNGGRADDERRATIWTGSIDNAPQSADRQPGWELDERGLLAQVVDPAGVITRFSNDELGRPNRIEAADGTAATITYGPIGGVASITNALGQDTLAERSPGGRLERVRFTDGTGIDYSYDLIGRLLGTQDVAEGTSPGESWWTRFRYEATGQVDEATTPDGTVTATYGAGGTLGAVTGLDGSTVTYDRDADGLVVRRRHSDGSFVDYLRSESGRIVAVNDSVAGPVDMPEVDGPESMAATDVVRGAGTAGSLRNEANRIVADADGRTFRYDDGGRLIESLTADGDRWLFTYDTNGLLSRETHPHRGLRHFVYNAARQLVAIETDSGLDATFTYDAAGRRTTASFSNGERITYHWRGLHQLGRIERVDRRGRISTRRITYSGFGRPELVDDVSISWDDGLSGKPVQVGGHRYLRSGLSARPAVPDAEWRAGLVDDPWGDGFQPEPDAWMPDAAVGVGLGYRNELSVDGLVFMGERIYEPASRSFLTVDPLPAVPGSNAFVGVYTYAANDPVNLVDPSGRRPLTIDEFAEKRAELERSRFGNFVHPVTKYLPYVDLGFRVLPQLLDTVVVLGLSYGIGNRAEHYGLGDAWNHVYGNYVVPYSVQALYRAADGTSDPFGRGDYGGTFDTEIRQPFLAAGETGNERGFNAVIRGLEDTANPDQINPDEFEVIDHGNGSYTLVLPGVTDLSAPVAGFDPYDQSVRDNDQGAVYSLQSADVDDNIYAQYVAEYMATSDIPEGSDLMIIGHSYGADTAMDLASDEEFTSDYNVTHVVAAAYNSGPQTPHVNPDTQVLVLENANDLAVAGEALGHGPLVEDAVDPNHFENVVYRNFDGGSERIGHGQEHYIEFVDGNEDPEMAEFFESMDDGGFTRPGSASAVDVSLHSDPE